MGAKPVNGSGNRARSGAQTLLLLAAPLNVAILRALESGPKQQIELRRASGSPAQTTLRAQLKRLVEIGTIEKHRRNRFPGVLEYELTKGGRELLAVAAILERWLGRSPEAALALGSSAAKAAIKALAEGWTTTMLRSFAARSLSLTELDRVIASLSYPSLERRLSALRLAGLVEAQRVNGRGTPYKVTVWLRESIAPLAAAARWERRYLSQNTAPVGRLDIEAMFLLAVPLIDSSEELTGTCRIAAEINNGDKQRLAGAMVGLRDGHVASCTTQLQGDPDAWALGSTAAWLTAVLDHDVDGLELGGDCGLARSLLDALHGRLFRARPRSSSGTSLDS